ncbi:hypothetical protein NEDG_00493 [Nematocida displodere]|uniref:Rho-GAP domain-containing protein n=1 Tax=Nematocida displodere TaxID=1805483 RepID=A0A177EJG9_9MICR|nr:hypothetical protein NEDG_00493 [Nematocida displodere]
MLAEKSAQMHAESYAKILEEHKKKYHVAESCAEHLRKNPCKLTSFSARVVASFAFNLKKKQQRGLIRHKAIPSFLALCTASLIIYFLEGRESGEGPLALEVLKVYDYFRSKALFFANQRKTEFFENLMSKTFGVSRSLVAHAEKKLAEEKRPSTTAEKFAAFIGSARLLNGNTSEMTETELLAEFQRVEEFCANRTKETDFYTGAWAVARELYYRVLQRNEGVPQSLEEIGLVMRLDRACMLWTHSAIIQGGIVGHFRDLRDKYVQLVVEIVFEQARGVRLGKPAPQGYLSELVALSVKHSFFYVLEGMRDGLVKHCQEPPTLGTRSVRRLLPRVIAAGMALASQNTHWAREEEQDRFVRHRESTETPEEIERIVQEHRVCRRVERLNAIQGVYRISTPEDEIALFQELVRLFELLVQQLVDAWYTIYIDNTSNSFEDTLFATADEPHSQTSSDLMVAAISSSASEVMTVTVPGTETVSASEAVSGAVSEAVSEAVSGAEADEETTASTGLMVVAISDTESEQESEQGSEQESGSLAVVVFGDDDSTTEQSVDDGTVVDNGTVVDDGAVVDSGTVAQESVAKVQPGMPNTAACTPTPRTLPVQSPEQIAAARKSPFGVGSLPKELRVSDERCWVHTISPTDEHLKIPGQELDGEQELLRIKETEEDLKKFFGGIRSACFYSKDFPDRFKWLLSKKADTFSLVQPLFDEEFTSFLGTAPECVHRQSLYRDAHKELFKNNSGKKLLEGYGTDGRKSDEFISELEKDIFRERLADARKKKEEELSQPPKKARKSFFKKVASGFKMSVACLFKSPEPKQTKEELMEEWEAEEVRKLKKTPFLIKKGAPVSLAFIRICKALSQTLSTSEGGVFRVAPRDIDVSQRFNEYIYQGKEIDCDLLKRNTEEQKALSIVFNRYIRSFNNGIISKDLYTAIAPRIGAEESETIDYGLGLMLLATLDPGTIWLLKHVAYTVDLAGTFVENNLMSYSNIVNMIAPNLLASDVPMSLDTPRIAIEIAHSLLAAARNVSFMKTPGIPEYMKHDRI